MVFHLNLELTDALSNVLSPTPMAKTGKPWRETKNALNMLQHTNFNQKKKITGRRDIIIKGSNPMEQKISGLKSSTLSWSWKENVNTKNR